AAGEGVPLAPPPVSQALPRGPPQIAVALVLLRRVLRGVGLERRLFEIHTCDGGDSLRGDTRVLRHLEHLEKPGNDCRIAERGGSPDRLSQRSATAREHPDAVSRPG